MELTPGGGRRGAETASAGPGGWAEARGLGAQGVGARLLLWKLWKALEGPLAASCSLRKGMEA